MLKVIFILAVIFAPRESEAILGDGVDLNNPSFTLPIGDRNFTIPWTVFVGKVLFAALYAAAAGKKKRSTAGDIMEGAVDLTPAIQAMIEERYRLVSGIEQSIQDGANAFGSDDLCPQRLLCEIESGEFGNSREKYMNIFMLRMLPNAVLREMEDFDEEVKDEPKSSLVECRKNFPCTWEGYELIAKYTDNL